MKPDFLNDDELDKPGPELSKIKKENPFKVPENYFDSLTNNIQQKINALTDFEKTSLENPFKVPEGYFDSLPTAIQQRIVDQKRKPVFGEWISKVFRPKYVLAFASIIVLLIVGIKYFTKSSLTDPQDNHFSCEEIKSSSYIADVDESMLIDILEQENKGTVKDDNSIEQYLIDNDIDISQLENHL